MPAAFELQHQDVRSGRHQARQAVGLGRTGDRTAPRSWRSRSRSARSSRRPRERPSIGRPGSRSSRRRRKQAMGIEHRDAKRAIVGTPQGDERPARQRAGILMPFRTSSRLSTGDPIRRAFCAAGRQQRDRGPRRRVVNGQLAWELLLGAHCSSLPTCRGGGGHYLAAPLAASKRTPARGALRSACLLRCRGGLLPPPLPARFAAGARSSIG